VKSHTQLDKLVVATDHEEIKATVEAFGGHVVMTDPACENGTERCLEVLNTLKAAGEYFDIVVNIQGDEPFIEAHHIDEVVRAFIYGGLCVSL
jgi:3-deoxy-manno-octulosonate cytidylyltransferase (CMP-KDO synthetase)